MNHIDLFSSIGGFAVALDLCGIPIEAQYHSDIEDYANKVYAKNFPNSTQLGDIKGINGHELRDKHTGSWLLSGGFPCQDVSSAGRRKGLAGERSGLWYEMLRLINELKPEIVFIENVANLRSNGLVIVLQGLASSGYDAQWRTLSAEECGAIHQRKRLWIIATPKGLFGNADETSGGTIGELPADQRDVGNKFKCNGKSHGLMSRAAWERCKAKRAIHRQPLLARRHDGLSKKLDWIARIKACGNAIVPQVAAKVLGDYLAEHPAVSALCYKTKA